MTSLASAVKPGVGAAGLHTEGGLLQAEGCPLPCARKISNGPIHCHRGGGVAKEARCRPGTEEMSDNNMGGGMSFPGTSTALGGPNERGKVAIHTEKGSGSSEGRTRLRNSRVVYLQRGSAGWGKTALLWRPRIKV